MLSVIVKGTWWISALQPVILSLGAIKAVVDLDVLEGESFELKYWLSSKKEQDETPQERPMSDADKTLIDGLVG